MHIFSSNQLRNRKKPRLFRFFLLLLALAAGIVLASRSGDSPREEAEKPAACDLLAGEQVAGKNSRARQLSHVIASGETFAGIFNAHRVARTRSVAFLEALGGAGLRTLYPGDSLVMTLAEDTVLTAVSFLSRNREWYHARLGESAVTAERSPVRVTEVRCLVNGTLTSSLAGAMAEVDDVGAVLTCKMADIFAWDINFFLDPRVGDSFQVFFTKRYAEGRFTGFGEVLAARYVCGDREYTAIGLPDENGVLQYYDAEGRSVQKEFLKAPLRYSRISSKFTYRRRHPVLGIVRPHLGIDYAAPTGTPVDAAADGTVRFAGWKGGYGKYVVIAHGGSYTTSYGHLSRIASGIRPGVRVRQGQTIGAVGSTGLSTGPHLDYRMQRGGRYVNPLTINLPSKKGIGASERAAFDRVVGMARAVFEVRCPEQGYFVLDINEPAAADSTHLLSAAGSNGVKSGS